MISPLTHLITQKIFQDLHQDDQLTKKEEIKTRRAPLSAIPHPGQGTPLQHFQIPERDTASIANGALLPDLSFGLQRWEGKKQ